MFLPFFPQARNVLKMTIRTGHREILVAAAFLAGPPSTSAGSRTPIATTGRNSSDPSPSSTAHAPCLTMNGKLMPSAEQPLKLSASPAGLISPKMGLPCQ